MSVFFHSIRWRVQAWHGAILLVVIAAFCLTTHRLALDHQRRGLDRNLIQLERSLIRGLIDDAKANGRAPEAFSPKWLMEYLGTGDRILPLQLDSQFQGTDPGYAYFSIRLRDGRVLLQSANAPADIDVHSGGSDFVEDIRSRGDCREIIHAGPDGLFSIVGIDTRPERAEMRRFAWSLGLVGLGVWLLGLLGGWWLAGRAIKPIAAISGTATRIAEGNLAERLIPGATDSELDQLSRVLNRTFDRLHGTLERQKQFTADASHELRTPVTILLSETQRILKRERTPEEYRAMIQTCHETARHMRELIETLVLLARQEGSGTERPHEPCDLATIAADTVKKLQPLATERGLTVQTEWEPALCAGDAPALAILTSNLVSNAIHHHDRTHGLVQVKTRREADHAVLEVSDDGPGIPADALPHIFERFYRADASRQDTGVGHAGLGLALVQAVVTNHQGAVHVENLPSGRGCRFTVRLPASPTA